MEMTQANKSNRVEVSISDTLPRPCPFCGDEAHAKNYKGGGWGVGCFNDKCRVKPDLEDFYRSKGDAIYTWNMRA